MELGYARNIGDIFSKPPANGSIRDRSGLHLSTYKELSLSQASQLSSQNQVTTLRSGPQDMIHR
jgi:hypothetical protein